MIHFVSAGLQRFVDVAGLGVIHFSPPDLSPFTFRRHCTMHDSLKLPGFMRFTDVAGVSRILKEHHDSVCIAGSGEGGGRAENGRRFFSLPTTARGNRRDQPIDLSSL